MPDAMMLTRPDMSLTGAGRMAVSAFCGACVALPAAEHTSILVAVLLGGAACVAAHEAFSRFGSVRNDGADVMACGIVSDFG